MSTSFADRLRHLLPLGHRHQVDLAQKLTASDGFFCRRQILEELTELPVMVDLASDFLDRGTPIFR